MPDYLNLQLNALERIEELEKLEDFCRAFIKKQGIGCAETIYQCDWVSENALQFIEGVCDIVGYERDEWSERDMEDDQ